MSPSRLLFKDGKRVVAMGEYDYKCEKAGNREWQQTPLPWPGNNDNRDYNFDERDSYGRESYGTYDGRPSNKPKPLHNPEPGSFWGRGYGHAGPPVQHRHYRENETVGFLLRCGVLKQTLKDIPNFALRLMEPKHCGVCSQRFNNFDGARLHYSTKNHNKNVKKWLTQHAKVGSQRPKEIPYRPRDMYCELCDVRITSQIHAGSHYGGRQHRAIVDGEKVPKNPFLLQKNMQERVKQLILREKQTIKKSAASEDVLTSTKPASPELYCGICKTFVTCSDQMTSHLNGRKHLSKEKRHILDVMQGGAINPNPAKTTATDADAEGTDAQEKADINDSEDQFDWGQGSSAWDDDPQQTSNNGLQT